MSVSEPLLTLSARPVQSREDWEAVARFTTAYMPDGPVSTDQVMRWATETPADVFVRREVLSVDGQDVATYRIIEPYWTEARSALDIRVLTSYDPAKAEVYRSAIRYVTEQPMDAKFATHRIWSKSDYTAYHQVLLDLGFVEGQRNPECLMHVVEFDETPYLPAIDKVKAAGYEIIDGIELRARFPDTWKHELWRLDDDIMRDVPLPEPWSGVEFEVFSKMCDDPTMRPDGHYYALKDGQIAAQSEIHLNVLNPAVGHTGLTGVRREHRRVGLATALKTSSLLWAKSVGIERVFTDNEEKNPMRNINLAMGFKTAYEWIEMTRPIR